MTHTALPLTALGVAFLAVLTPIAAAQNSNPEVPLFSLAAGNRWTYVCVGAEDAAVYEEVRVAEQVRNGSARMSRIENFMFPVGSQDLLFYNDRCAKTCEVNPLFPGVQGRPSTALPLSAPWYPCKFGCALGGAIELPRMETDCTHGARGLITQIGAPITVPAGHFESSITITYYEHPCCDDQVLTETFVPGVGLVQRTVARLPGTQEWSLCFALVEGKLIGSPDGCRPESETPRATATEVTTWGTLKAMFR